MIHVRALSMRAAGIAGALALAAAFAPLPATADPATDAALRTLVTTIDASPDWLASFQGLTSDPTGASVMTGLKVESTLPGMTIAIDTLTVTRGTASANGQLAATKVVAGTIAVSAGPLAVTMTNVTLDDFSAPAGLAFSFEPLKPFSTMIRAYSAFARTHLGQARAASIAVTEKLAANTSRVTYSDVNLARLDGGRITTLSAGPMLSETPIADQVNVKPLVTIRVARAESKNLDLAAMLRVYEGVPPGVPRTWTTAVSNTTYRDASVTAAGIGIRLGTISLDDLKVRPAERNVADDFDRALVTPFEEGVSSDPAGFLNLLSAYSVGRLTATPIDISAVGFDTLHLESLSIANLSLDGLGEFALNGLSAGVHGLASAKAGRIAFGGMTFPKADVIAATLRTAFSGGDVDVSAVAPAVGFVELGAIDLDVVGYPSTRIGKFRMDLANHVGAVPTSLRFDIADADLDAVLMPGILREQLSKFGYTRLNTSLAGKIEWSEAKKTTTITGLRLAAKDVGTLGIDAVLAGPSRADVEALDSLAALQGLRDKVALVSGTLSFKDDSIVGRVLTDQAVGVKVDPDRFRDQFARGLPFMLLPVGSPDFQKKAAPVFQEFIRTPGTVTFTAAPAMPIALPQLIAAAGSSGIFNLPTLLNLSVAGVPGPKPPAPAAAPAPQSPAPAPAPTAPSSLAPPPADIRGTLQPPR